MQRIFDNFKDFLIIWGVVLIANQVLLFGGCLAPYCIIAAIPHTLIISLVISYFWLKEKVKETNPQVKSSTKYDPRANRPPKQPDYKPKSKQSSGSTKRTDSKTLQKTDSEDDVLKNRGDGYELYIGRKFELKGDLVIYNGFIRGYEDQGVDIIVISKSTQSLHLIQCKHWKRFEFTREHLYQIYRKLDNFGSDYQDIDPAQINNFLSVKKENGEISSRVRESLNYHQIRKTLYLSSSHVVQKDVWNLLEQIKENIYRFQDMKIVVHKI